MSVLETNFHRNGMDFGSVSHAYWGGLLSHPGTNARLALPVPGLSLAAAGTLVISAAARAAGLMLPAVIRVTGPDDFECLHRISIQP